jgi:hypothetical protein
MTVRLGLPAMAGFAFVFALGACSGSEVTIASAPDGGTGGNHGGAGAGGSSVAMGGSSVATGGHGGSGGAVAMGGATGMGGSVATGGHGGSGGAVAMGGAAGMGGAGMGGSAAGAGGSSAGDGGPVCAHSCTTENAKRCAGSRMQTCAMTLGGCLAWTTDAACPMGQTCNSTGVRCIAPPMACMDSSECGCGCACDNGACRCTGGLPPSCMVDSDCAPACSGVTCEMGKCKVP